MGEGMFSSSVHNEIQKTLRAYESVLAQYPHHLKDYEVTTQMISRFYQLGDYLYQNPSRHLVHHFTVTTLVIHEDQTRCLLCFHKKCQKWIPLGGHLEDDDQSVYAGALREVIEESGLKKSQLSVLSPVNSINHDDLVTDLDIHQIQAYGDEGEHDHYDFRFLMLSSTSTLCPSCEVSYIKWLDWDQAMAVADQSTQRLIQKSRYIIARSIDD